LLLRWTRGSVVDQNIQTVPQAFGLGHDAFRARFVGNISGHRLGNSAALLDLLRHLFRSVGDEIDYQYARTLFRHLQTSMVTDSRAPASDHSDLIFQPHS
jgi:hypothetical protein